MKRETNIESAVPLAGLKASRRNLLKGAGMLSGTLALSSTLAALAPGRAWALDMKALSSHQGRVILRFTRYLYPHPSLEDAVYALVVKDLDDKASADADSKNTLAQGVAQLDQIGGEDWLKRSAALQEIDVASMESTNFFKLVRSTAVVSLYSNEMAYAHFGYGGPAGNTGYLYKGFNDLTWLPDPPPTASGPIPPS
ncbi:twin-arginine translocation signal domain-containing protein [Acidocella sp.]|uniref:twin-arginine translocation signal domain-containing protein n=1 Tax=Acidocella sp. TaxID=50710 RepID=UPI0025C45D9C|nr:twin-arginine translocation signal domain-containing protein [Acidocella sp.]